MSFHDKSAEQVLKELSSDSKEGLSSEEAEDRLHKYGLNEIKEEKGSTPLKIFIEQFKNPLVIILIVATFISLLVKEYVDASVIGFIVIVNAILGFVQEYKAEKAIEALMKMTSPKAKVIREGREKEIESKNLVPGDIVVLDTGDKIPADARIFELSSFETQEATLTGESTPVQKTIKSFPKDTPTADRRNLVFSGTIVTKGHAKAVVYSTGMKTEFGKIAKSIQTTEEDISPLQKKLKKLSKYLGLVVILITIGIFITGLLRGEPRLEMFLIAVALAVAAVPQGLPAVVTISLAISVQRMIKRNALVRKLHSVETLGSVDVICTDKTGTLTHNQMTVKKILVDEKTYEVTGAGYSKEGAFSLNNKLVEPNEDLKLLLKIGALCNNSEIEEEDEKRQVLGDPTEGCLIVSAEKAGFKINHLEEAYPRVNEIPFSSERKRMTTIHKKDDKKLAFVKGAPDVILDLCDRIIINGKLERLTRQKKKEILEKNEEFAEQALRVLGFAYKDDISSEKEEEVERNLVFVGLQAMIDPPREEVKEAIKKCETAGMRVIMITGDHKTTALAIAKELGIKGKAIAGQEIKDLDLDKEVEKISIYARVDPQHKLGIIDALKKKGHNVAMTGDGVNDAPALKKADIGVAMGLTGTDVSKEASDIILTDDNFTSIVNAVEEGRNVFDNIKKFLVYLLSSNSGEVLTLFTSMLLGLPLPLFALQILWINLVTDGAPAIALSVEPPEKDIMDRPPRKNRENIIDRKMVFWIVIAGIIMAVGTLSAFVWSIYQSGGGFDIGAGESPHHYLYAATLAFSVLVMFQMFNVLNSKTLKRSVFKELLNNKWLVLSIFSSIALQIVVVYAPFLNHLFHTVPLSAFDWVIVFLISSSILWIGEIVKFFYRRNDKS